MRDVVIVGAGPTGLMLAGELALAGVDVLLIERRLDQRLTGSRAGGLHARSLEVLDQRGIVGRFLAEGQVAQAVGFAFNRLDISDFPTRHNYVLGLWQKHIERILAGWVAELPVEVRRGDEVVGLAQDAEGVDVRLGDGEVVRARYLVGCDGGRSVVRKATGIEFAGWDAAMSSLLAEVEMTQVPPFGVHRTAVGLHSFGRVDYEIRDGVIVYAETGPVTVMVSEAKVGAEGEPGLADLRAALIAACGTDYGLQRAQWVSRFTDMSRQAVQYRQGRVLLAGDAAHVHGPHGGQGLNTGVQDAVNLGWKLAQVVKGVAGDGLLDSYHAERHPVAARVLRNTMAQVALSRPDERSAALRETMADLLGLEAARRRVAGMLTGLDISYDLGEGHPLLGRRMPDLDLVTQSGVRRVYELLHAARGVLVGLGAPVDIAPWAGRVDVVQAGFGGVWELPVLGVVPAPSAVLIRPDGHVAWVGQGDLDGLTAALTRWFGPGE